VRANLYSFDKWNACSRKPTKNCLNSADELVLNTVLSIAAVTTVVILFIPHWTAAVIALPMISILYIDLMGFLQVFGVAINPVSYISLVMSIGLLVDFVIHVLLRYYESSGNRMEKTTEMLRTMGASVLVAGLSTFLGILPLAFSKSEIFFTVFLAFFGLVILGLTHGLIVLPVVLSMIGPEDQIFNGEESREESEPKKILAHEETILTEVEC
jgi:Niemann-Pick C1 protein